MTQYSRSPLSSGRLRYEPPVHHTRPTALTAAKPRLSIRYVVIAAALLFAVVIIVSGLSRHASAQHAANVQQQQQQAAARQQRILAASAQVNQLIAANPQVDFSIVSQAITGDQASSQQQLGTTGVADAGSVGKLLTATAWFSQTESGQQSMTAKLGGQSAKNLLQTMIVNSDDQAWLLLNERLTHATLSSYARSIGLADYDVENNLLSSADVANLLSQLWGGHLLSSSDRTVLLGYLKQANYRDYIVAGAPSGATVYHKVGIDGDHVNDSAIITEDGKAMSLVIMTNGNGTYDWANRAVIMQQITKLLADAYLS